MEDREGTIREGKRALLPFFALLLSTCQSTYYAEFGWPPWNTRADDHSAIRIFQAWLQNNNFIQGPSTWTWISAVCVDTAAARKEKPADYAY